MEIFLQGDPVALGSGWYAPESYRGEEFRWVNNDAQLNVAQMLAKPYLVSMSVEPGPGVGLKPFDLKVIDQQGNAFATLPIKGRQTVSFDLPAGPPRIHQLILHVDGGGKTALRDNRVLNFRVFELSVRPGQSDIISLQLGLKVGTGWYPLETFNRETFRWAGNEAIIEVEDPGKFERIELDVEPGPGVDLKPFKLNVLDEAGKSIAEIDVKERQRIEIPGVKADGPVKYRLRAEGGGRSGKGDPRILNFRAFSSA